jgi:hypothetical protein
LFCKLKYFYSVFCTVCLCSVQIRRERRGTIIGFERVLYNYRCHLKMETGLGWGGGFCVKLCN